MNHNALALLLLDNSCNSEAWYCFKNESLKTMSTVSLYIRVYLKMRTTIHKVRHVRQQTRIPQILHADDFTASEKIFNVKSLTCIHVQGDLTAKVSNIKSQVVVKRKVIISPSLKCTESLTLYIVFLIGSFNCCRQLTTSFKLIRSPFQVIIFFTFVICACISVQIFLKLNMNIFSISSWD